MVRDGLRLIFLIVIVDMDGSGPWLGWRLLECGIDGRGQVLESIRGG